MILPKFLYHQPSTIEEACEIMAELQEKAKPLAGGTDLLVNMKKHLISPENLVFLGRIPSLRDQGPDNGTLRIGACVTAGEMAEGGEIKGAFEAVAQGASSLGSPLIRNLATIGGNLVSARPAADFPPPLMAYGGRAILKSATGERTLPLDEFFLGPGQTAIRSDEILLEILMDRPPSFSGAGYLKLGVRNSLEISIVNVASFISLDSPDGTITAARIVLGAVAPMPLRARSAEKILAGEKPSEALFEQAAKAAVKDSRPIDDFRGSAEYRRDMVEVLTLRTLGSALARAKASG